MGFLGSVGFTRQCLTAVAAAAVAVGLSASPAGAANPDACGLLTQHEMARAFGLTNSAQQKSVLREPGNSAGVVRIRCRASAWSGSKPTTPAAQRVGLLAGTYATYKIETWVADNGPAGQTWLAHFPATLKGLKSAARTRFIESPLGGKSFVPATYGDAEAGIGYEAVSGQLRKTRGFWWNSTTGTLVSFNLVEGRDNAARQALSALAQGILRKLG